MPGVASRVLFRTMWKRAWIVMLAAMIVDLDHVLASPIYDASRCSVGFHPLHSYPAIAVYALLAALPRTRVAGVGLLLHMIVDAFDCVWMELD